MTKTETKREVVKIDHKGIPIEGPWIGFDRCEDRRHKKYSGQVTMRFEVDDAEQVTGGFGTAACFGPAVEVVVKAFLSRLQATFTNPQGKIEPVFTGTVRSSGGWSDVHKGKHKAILYVEIRQHVARPKDIPTGASDVLGAFGAARASVAAAAAAHVTPLYPNPIEDVVRDAMKGEIDATFERQGQDKRRRDAERVARHLAKGADTAARDITRFGQKLAALEAELEAERLVQLKKLVEEMQAEKQVKDEAGEVFDPRSVEAGIKHAAAVFPALRPGMFPGGIGERDFIKAEEV